MKTQDESLTCQQVNPLLEPYLDGELPAPMMRRLHRHLARCPACAQELALATAVRQELRALRHLDLPEASIAALLERTREASEETPSQGPTARHRRLWDLLAGWSEALRGPRLAWLATAAAALTVALLSTWLWRAPNPGRSDGAAVTQTEVQEAEVQTRLALAYLARASRQAGEDLRDDILARRVVAPTERQLRQTLAGAWPLAGIAEETTPSRRAQDSQER